MLVYPHDEPGIRTTSSNLSEGALAVDITIYAKSSVAASLSVMLTSDVKAPIGW